MFVDPLPLPSIAVPVAVSTGIPPMSAIDYSSSNKAGSSNAEAGGPQPTEVNECNSGTGATSKQGGQIQGAGPDGIVAKIEGLLAQVRRLDTDADGRALKAFVTRLIRDENAGALACWVEVLEHEVLWAESENLALSRG